MRDILVMSIVMVAALLALKRPWIGVMLWTWLSIMNPHRFTYGFAYSAPVAAIAAAATMLGLLMTRERQSPFQGAPTYWFLALAIWITTSWLMGLNIEGDYYLWTKVMKIYVMTFVAMMLLKNRYHILAFAWVTAGSLALLGLKGGIFTILTGGSYRVWGPPGSFISGNNELALALVMTVPMVYFLRSLVTNRLLRAFLMLVMITCAASAIGSYSRGGLLGVAAMSAFLWWRSKSKLMLGVLLVFGALVALPLMPEAWWARMDTISTYQQDESALGRLNAWTVAWEVAKHHVFGGGMGYQYPAFFQQYGPYEATPRAAHSIYFQVLGNHGFIGLGLFLFVWFSTYRTAGWLRRYVPEHSSAHWVPLLGGMIQVSLVGYAVGGAFLSLAYFDLPYDMMVMAVLAKQWVMRRGWETDPKEPFMQYAGLRRARRPVNHLGGQ